MSTCSCMASRGLDQLLDPLVERDGDGDDAGVEDMSDFKRLASSAPSDKRAAPDLEQHDAGGDREIERIGAARPAECAAARRRLAASVSGRPCCSLPISSSTGRPA